MERPKAVVKIEFTMSTNNKNCTGQSERWIGLAHVRPWAENDLLGASEAAMVAVVGDAENPLMFLALVESQFRNLQFDVLSLEDVEPLALRLARQSLPADLRKAITALSPTSVLALGTFHAYTKPA